MKLIIYQYEESVASCTGYRNCVKMGYLLGARVALLGICEREYLMPDLAAVLSSEEKAHIILMYQLGDHVNRSVVRFESTRMLLQKKKNKSSADIVHLAKMLKLMDELFESTVIERYNVDIFGLRSMKDLLDGDRLYFYHEEAGNAWDKLSPVIAPLEVLLLKLPDPEKGMPVFFLNINGEDDRYVMNVDVVDPEDKSAEDLGTIYGLESFVFPLTNALTGHETRLAGQQLEGLTGEFMERIEEWAAVCYANPNSTAGLEYFREQMTGFLPGFRDRAEESPVLRNLADLTRRGNMGRLIVGEAPIEKIWEIYMESNTISKIDYGRLMVMKRREYPRYEGRWPVFIYDIVVDVLEEDGVAEGLGEELVSVRKRIMVD